VPPDRFLVERFVDEDVATPGLFFLFLVTFTPLTK
jgi:hypothetical protein